MEEVKYIKKKIDYNWVQQLDKYTNNGLLKWPRNIRKTQVGRLHKILTNGEYWDTPIVVNHMYKDITTKRLTPRDLQERTPIQIHIIDGTHRLHALKLFYRNKINREIVFNQQFAIYSNKTEGEEREIYEKWNSGVRQNNNDWLVVNQDDVKLWQKIKNDNNFPMKVVLGSVHKNSLPFYDLYYAFGSCVSNEGKFNPSPPTFTDLNEYNKSLNEKSSNKETYEKLKKYLVFFKRRFGDEGKSNVFQKSNLFYPLLDIYMKNVGYTISENDLFNSFAVIMGNADIIEKGKMYSCRSLKVELRKMIVDIINKNKKTKLK